MTEKKIAVMQPYFFPYIGYFQLINAVNLFVVYDDGNMIINGFIHKNRILTNNVKTPCQDIILRISKKRIDQTINEVILADNSHNLKKIERSIVNHYQKAPYFSDVLPVLQKCLFYKEDNLVKYLVHQLHIICDYIGINTPFVFSSEVPKDGLDNVEDKVYRICHHFNIFNYINPIGGKELYSKEKWAENGVNLSFLKRDDNLNYKQYNNTFVKDLSIIDVLMFNSKEEILCLLEQYKLV